MSNQRQLYLGFALYADDWSGYMPSPPNNTQGDYHNMVQGVINGDIYATKGIGVLYEQSYLSHHRIAFCSDHTYNSFLFDRGDDLALKQAYDTGVLERVIPNANWVNTTYVLRGRSNDGVTANADGSGWPNYVHAWGNIGMASHLEGNMPGGKFIAGSTVLGELKSPRAILMCATRIDYWGVNSWAAHNSRGFNAMYADGVVATFNCDPSHPAVVQNGTKWPSRMYNWADPNYPGYALHTNPNVVPPLGY